MQPITQERIDDLVYRQLLDNIKTNVWKSGEKLPSENELCAQLNVSRIPETQVHRACGVPEGEGNLRLLQRRPV